MDKEKRIEKLKKELEKIDKSNLDTRKKFARSVSLQRLIKKLGD